MLNIKSVVITAAVLASVALAADANAQRRSGAMGRAADRAAAPRGGVAPVTRSFVPPPTRIAPRVVTGYPYRGYRPYYYGYRGYRPGLRAGLYSGYAPYRYGYYAYPYVSDYPYNYTYFNNYAYNYPY